MKLLLLAVGIMVAGVIYGAQANGAPPPPLAVQNVVVYADVVVVAAWRNRTSVFAHLALADGRDVDVWIPPLRRLPAEYRGGALNALSQLETWTDTDQAPLRWAKLFFNPRLSHASVQLLRTRGGLVLSWLKRR